MLVIPSVGPLRGMPGIPAVLQYYSATVSTGLYSTGYEGFSSCHCTPGLGAGACCGTGPLDPRVTSTAQISLIVIHSS